MGYKLESHPSYHHLVKKANGGKKTINNGAILNEVAHHYLHLIESYDLELYDYINSILKKENEQGYLSRNHLKTIDKLLYSFEKEHCGTYNANGKLLIKEEYTQRKKIL